MIEKAIHEIITNREDTDAVGLSLALLGDRIVTGNVQSEDMDLPYATINLESNLSKYRSNKTRCRQPVVRFNVWHEDHAQGCKIRDGIQELFEDKKFETPDSKMISTFHENDFAVQEPDGVWQFVIDIRVTTQRSK